MKTAYIALGANLGDREKSLQDALALLAAKRIFVTRRSSVYETAPQDVVDQPTFLNMVVECQTVYGPLPLLAVLLGIETALGRDRNEAAVPKGPRRIDLDILLFGDEVISLPELVVPHPRMLARRFVLEPLLEIAPGLRHPVTREPLARSLAAVLNQETTKRG